MWGLGNTSSHFLNDWMIDRMKKKKYKSFRKQFQECEKNKTRYSVMCYMCGQEILICDKYKEVCHSKACLKERLS